MRAAILGVVGVVLLSATGLAQVDERVIYASVVDNKGQPVLGVNARDLLVREDGQSREILNVVKDEDPFQVALLVDNSVEMRNRVAELRSGLSAFISGVRPGAQVAVLTLAERPTIAVNYTADKSTLLKGVGSIVAYDAGNYLLDGIAEAAEGLAKRASARSVMVVITGQGPELSYRHYTEALRALHDSAAALHAIMVTGRDGPPRAGDRSNSLDPNDPSNGIGRDIVLGRMTKETGGRYDEVITMNGLTSRLQQLASELSNQYRVTYARPPRLIPPKNTEISTRQPNQHARGMLIRTPR